MARRALRRRRVAERDLVKAFAEELERGWGTGVWIGLFAPSRAKDPGVRDYWARYQQLSASPTSALRFFRAAIEDDVRDLLPAISVPTIIIHAERDPVVPLAQAQYIADRIEGAEMVALDSDVHLICTSDVIDELADAAHRFIEGLSEPSERPEREHVPVRQ